MFRRRNPTAQGPSPCSACKVLRKGCQGNCELSECFPISRLAAYKQAHAIFGSAHIKKIVKTVHPEKMKDAADSILMEADFWKRSPRIGCLGVVLDLYEQIDLCERQLELVNHLLSEYHLFVATWMAPIRISDGGSQAEQESVTNDFDLNVMAAGSTMLDDPGCFVAGTRQLPMANCRVLRNEAFSRQMSSPKSHKFDSGTESGEQLVMQKLDEVGTFVKRFQTLLGEQPSLSIRR